METINPSFDTWTSLFLIAVGQGLFLTLVIILKGWRKANILLGALFFVFSLMLLQYVLFWTNYVQVFPHFLGIVVLAMYLLTPLLYLYLKVVKNNGHLAAYNYVHFLPALLLFTLLAPNLLLDASAKANLLQEGSVFYSDIPLLNQVGFLALPKVQIVYQLVYQVFFIVLVFGQNRGVPSDQFVNIRNRWLRTLFFLYLGFILSYIGYYVMIFTGNYKKNWDYLISAFMCLFIYTVGWLGYRQPEIFEGQILKNSFLSKKYRSSTLTPGASKSILKKLNQIMRDEKPFLDSGLRLDDLADLVHCNRHQLSQVLNQEIGKNFPEYINDFRFETARQFLLDPGQSHLPVREIGYTAGFNNPTTFTKVFKEKTGFTPKAFQVQHLQERAGKE
ncbi:MAG: hypothetical protein DHS20C18_27430 [Saprospiraceae bacterium]|nr:MAG: hypothetical protein DHS20C18_27430 [Saprospiraceae bacterium]